MLSQPIRTRQSPKGVGKSGAVGDMSGKCHVNLLTEFSMHLIGCENIVSTKSYCLGRNAQILWSTFNQLQSNVNLSGRQIQHVIVLGD